MAVEPDNIPTSYLPALDTILLGLLQFHTFHTHIVLQAG